ncbi:MAG: shikimate dehydrogenase [Alphaproteobacteria bacterium]|nr:shikimate dehydrogenase [Alphaproteobacteria bacterium]
MISGKARLAGVIGWPIGHSRSPRLHAYWLDRYGIDGAYIPLRVPPDRLAYVLRALAYAGFKGINVTVPHKEAALTLMDEVSPEARRIGAVNTIVFDDRERMIGSNTDGYGFIENIRSGHPSWTATSGPAVVLGSGGAARAVCAALLAQGSPEIRLINRTPERAMTVAGDLGGPIQVIPWAERSFVLNDCSLLVNTTTLGMQGGLPLDLDLSRLPVSALVTDIVYTPLETELLRTARARGNPVMDGLGMLLHQARPGFSLWFGVEPEVTPALRDWVLGTG